MVLDWKERNKEEEKQFAFGTLSMEFADKRSILEVEADLKETPKEVQADPLADRGIEVMNGPKHEEANRYDSPDENWQDLLDSIKEENDEEERKREKDEVRETASELETFEEQPSCTVERMADMTGVERDRMSDHEEEQSQSNKKEGLVERQDMDAIKESTDFESNAVAVIEETATTECMADMADERKVVDATNESTDERNVETVTEEAVVTEFKADTAALDQETEKVMQITESSGGEGITDTTSSVEEEEPPAASIKIEVESNGEVKTDDFEPNQSDCDRREEMMACKEEKMEATEIVEPSGNETVEIQEISGDSDIVNKETECVLGQQQMEEQKEEETKSDNNEMDPMGSTQRDRISEILLLEEIDADLQLQSEREKTETIEEDQVENNEEEEEEGQCNQPRTSAHLEGEAQQQQKEVEALLIMEGPIAKEGEMVPLEQNGTHGVADEEEADITGKCQTNEMTLEREEPKGGLFVVEDDNNISGDGVMDHQSSDEIVQQQRPTVNTGTSGERSRSGESFMEESCPLEQGTCGQDEGQAEEEGNAGEASRHNHDDDDNDLVMVMECRKEDVSPPIDSTEATTETETGEEGLSINTNQSEGELTGAENTCTLETCESQGRQHLKDEWKKVVASTEFTDSRHGDSDGGGGVLSPSTTVECPAETHIASSLDATQVIHQEWRSTGPPRQLDNCCQKRNVDQMQDTSSGGGSGAEDKQHLTPNLLHLTPIVANGTSFILLDFILASFQKKSLTSIQTMLHSDLPECLIFE